MANPWIFNRALGAVIWRCCVKIIPRSEFRISFLSLFKGTGRYERARREGLEGRGEQDGRINKVELAEDVHLVGDER
jgi:hypothetical protein